MSWPDIIIVAVIAISAVVSLFRGFVREAFSLLAWITASWVGWNFREPMSAMLTDYVEVPSVRMLVAFGLLFLATLLIGALVNYLLVQLIQKTGLSGTDRILGLVFGLARGVVIISLILIAASHTALPQDPWWQQSQLIQYFDGIGQELLTLYEENIRRVYN